MNRVSTAGNYATVLANLTASQARQIEAGGQVSSQKKATDLKGYARNAETLTAMRSLQTRVDGFLGQTQLLKDKLTVQDTALNQVTDAVQKARLHGIPREAETVMLERDMRLGTTVGAEAFGAYLPYVLHGITGSPSWGIATAGANLGYRYLRRDDLAKQDGHVGASTLTLRVDDQSTLGARWQLRTFFDLSYTVCVGRFEGQSTVGFAHALVGSAGMALVVDVSAGPATRLVPRTDPETGVVTYRTAVNEGSRLRIALFDVTLETRPFDTLTTIGPTVHGQAGIIHDF